MTTYERELQEAIEEYKKVVEAEAQMRKLKRWRKELETVTKLDD